MTPDGESGIFMDQDVCVHCQHPVDRHGLDQVGCSDCSCGFDGDWVGDE